MFLRVQGMRAEHRWT